TTILLWKRLAKDDSLPKLLVEEATEYIVSFSTPDWEDRNLVRPAPDGSPRLLETPSQQRHRIKLSHLAKEAFETICTKPKLNETEILRLAQNDINDAANGFLNVLQHLAWLLPHSFSLFLGQAIVESGVLEPPRVMPARTAKRRGPAAPAPPTMGEVFPQHVDSSRPIKEYLKSFAGTAELKKSVKGFKFMTLALAGTISHKFNAKSFHFTHNTAYFYSCPGEGNYPDPNPPLLHALRNLQANELEQMGRLKAASDDRDREHREDEIMNGEPEFAAADDGEVYFASDNDDDDDDLDKNVENLSRFAPSRYAWDHMKRLDQRTRRSKDVTKSTRGERSEDFAHLRSSELSPDDEASTPQSSSDSFKSSTSSSPAPDPTNDSSRRFSGRRINGLHGLLPAERVAAIRTSYPNRPFSEALASCAFFDIAETEKGSHGRDGEWIEFELNEERVKKVCDTVRTFYETVVAAPNRSERLSTLTHLRADILTLLFKVDRPGTFVPWVYTVTPWSINITYIDPRFVKNVPSEIEQLH
ncbi:uncharacterized protein JCM6883_004815, partial [Sporobolomyces salmoneus]|uniref:uncharacterized protein n=1 Tax=Sporobolomyces salmoneus TaxID=183962 RepID=UPI0031799CFD